MSKSDISDFVMQPLHKKLNRENLVSRMERLEAGETSAVPSARVQGVGEMAQSTGSMTVDELLVVNHDAGLIDVVINQYGILFRNQQGEMIFQDTSGGSTIAIYSDAGNWLTLANQVGNVGIRFVIDNASHVVKQIDFDGDGNIDLFDGVYKIAGITAFPIQNAESVMDSTGFTISSTDFQDTGLFVTLPAAGTYRIHGDVRGALRPNGGAGTTTWWVSAELYNATDAAAVANSERLVVLTTVNSQLNQMTCPINQIVTVTASKQINLYAQRDGNGTPAWTTTTIESNTAGRTVLSWEKIG